MWTPGPLQCCACQKFESDILINPCGHFYCGECQLLNSLCIHCNEPILQLDLNNNEIGELDGEETEAEENKTSHPDNENGEEGSKRELQLPKSLTILTDQGTCTFSNGDKYEGEFKAGFMSGWGKYVYAKDNSMYEGQFKFDKKWGQGKEYLADGVIAEGEYKDNLKHGKFIVYKDGEIIFEGDFKDNMRNGHGKTYHKGVLMYDGEYKNSWRCGHGKSYYNEFDQTYEKGTMYEGKFKYDRFYGFGALYLNGIRYFEGHFQQVNVFRTLNICETIRNFMYRDYTA